MMPLKNKTPIKFLKTLSLAVLVLQSTSLVIFLRYTRTQPGDKYLTSTAVLLSEVQTYKLGLLRVYGIIKSS